MSTHVDAQRAGEAVRPGARVGRGRALAASLRLRLLALVLMALVPAFALMLYNAYQDRQDAGDKARQDAATLTQLSVVQQEQVLEGSRQLLVTLSPLASAADLSTIDTKTCQPVLASLLSNLTFYADFGIATTEGNVVCSAASSGAGNSIASRASFGAAIASGQFAVGQFLADPISGKQVIDMTYPIRGADGAVRGAMYLDLDLGWLNGQLASAKLPEGAVFAMVDSAGTVIARYPDPADYVGKAFPDSPVISEVLAKKQGTEELTGSSGDARLYGFTQITEPVPTGLYALVGIPKSTAFAAANDNLTRSVIAIVVVTMLVIAAAWLGSELFVIRQTRRLVTATRLVSGGDLSARSGVSATGEIGELAAAFDEMARSLERRAGEQRRAEDELRRVNESLEERVRERTQEVREHAEQLTRSNAELEDFTYVVSHDLKEPLRGIEAFSGFLADDYGDRLDDEGRRYVAVVRESSVRMKDLIEDLLQLSRVNREQAPIAPADIGGVVREALEDLRFAIADKHADVRLPESWPTVACDRLRLKEVFKNLISNAIKFSDKPQPHVDLTWRHLDGKHEFAVVDDGIGIDQEYHERVFQIFQRLERREDYPGTGAGLAICKKVIEAHGGSIGVDSVRGEGSKFWFTIPDGLDRQTEGKSDA